MKIVVMNAAVGAWYPKGQDRLVASLLEHQHRRPHGHNIEFKMWTDCLPPGCPAHSVVPYAFKPCAFRWAVQQGYDIALWFDASMWATRSIDPIIDHVGEYGCALWRAGFTVANWCHDQGLAKMGLTREVAASIPLLCGGICGFNLRKRDPMSLLTAWYDYARDGVSFPGPWRSGATGEDPKLYLGHRHDMPTLSHLARNRGVQPIDCPKWFAYSTDEQPAHPEAIILARGM